jgi:hypothetical protein
VTNFKDANFKDKHYFKDALIHYVHLEIQIKVRAASEWSSLNGTGKEENLDLPLGEFKVRFRSRFGRDLDVDLDLDLEP